MYDIAIFCSLNDSDLPSTIFDIVHLYMLFFEHKMSKEIHLLSMNTEYTKRVFVNEHSRLAAKGLISLSLKEPKVEEFSISTLKSLLQPHKKIVVSISGHGYSGIQDVNESDNRGEYIQASRIIRDDELFHIFNLPSDILILVDTCHSGTMIDLPLVMNSDGSYRQENKNITRGNIISISSVSDSQLSMDSFSTYGFGGNLISNYIDFVLTNQYKYEILIKYMLIKSHIVSISSERLIPSSISYGKSVSFTYKKI